MNVNYIGKPIRCLFDEDFHDYDSAWKTNGRTTARGLIVQGDQILLNHSGANDFYGLPGGGVEGDEHLTDTLVREVKEETGYEVIRKSVKSYGYTKMTKADYNNPETTFIGMAYVFTANVNLNTRTAPELTDSEKNRKMECVWVPITDLRKIVSHTQKAAAKMNLIISGSHTTVPAGFLVMNVYRDTKILDIFAKDMHL